jgi:hypothetical protein
MALRDQIKLNIRHIPLGIFLFVLAFSLFKPQLAAAQNEDIDPYKLRIETYWFYSQPSGSFFGTGRNGSVDLQRDLGFNYYSTFLGRVDWKFTHKNHLFFVVAPFDQTKTVTLKRTVFFQGQTFTEGLVTSGELKANAYAVGYQYDIFRRRWGHLGVGAQINFYDTSASLNTMAQINGGIPYSSTRASGSLLAPIPVAGPDVRVYFLRRLFVTGNLQGMYFFGYGNYISTIDTLGVRIIKNRLSARAGYAVASKLNVNTSSDRIGIDLTQKGSVVGLEFSF